MMDKLTGFADYFRKIPVAFLVAIVFVLGLILFLPEEYAKTLAVDGFRSEYKVFLGPLFLLTLSFCAVRVFYFFRRGYRQRQILKKRLEALHSLTPEEKGYLFLYIENQQNTLNAGLDDGIMAGLDSKGITYCASEIGNLLDGLPFNLQPLAREYLEKNRHLLDGYAAVSPMPPRKKFDSIW